MFGRMREDIRTVFEMDPAARSLVEVLLCYPGLHALWFYRWAHFFWTHRLKLLGRLWSHCGRFWTGIEIHPGATIGRRVFIDHGMAVVIGETAEVGDDVLMYQGVVLGGTSLEKHKRHPTIGNRVVIGSAAIVLGPIKVGDGARIGANSVVVNPVPPGATVVGVPGRIVEERQVNIFALEHGRLPDPVSDALKAMYERQGKLEDRIRELEHMLKVGAGTTARTEDDWSV
jgi:serine O-acetyltransferase